MSRLPAYFGARERMDDSAPPPEPDGASRAPVFGLLPPQPVEGSEPDPAFALPPRAEVPEPPPAEPPAAEPPPAEAPAGRNVHPLGIADLGRLSIDNDGRLYWDGKPVEVRRRILMSRAQIIGASLIGLFVAIGAVASAISGAAAARDWACRLGWTESYCTLPDTGPPPSTDIPA